MTTVAAWGPTLVMAGAVVLAGVLVLAYLGRAHRNRIGYYPSIRDDGSVVLSAAIRQAESINGYRPPLRADPDVHLRPIARIAPAKYLDAVAEIPAYFSQGRIVSIDLTGLSDRQAARLVDFCSGYLTGVSGWLFRAAEKVIVLTPTSGKADDAP